jgi:hypothetical protein
VAVRSGPRQGSSGSNARISGQTGFTSSYTDANAEGPGPFFYRVGVQ